MIDLHCHILWGIDDGPQDLEETVAMARIAAEAGTTHIVATPHVSWDWPQNTAASIAAGVAQVNAVLVDRQIALTVVPGAEIALSRVADLPADELAALGLGGGPWLLVEPPFSPAVADFEPVIDHLLSAGHKLVIAHPERCAAFVRRRDRLERYLAQGCVASVTAGSIAGAFGPKVRAFSIGLLRDGLAGDIASDAHAPTGPRTPVLGPELHGTGFEALADHLHRAVPRAVLDDAPLPDAPALPAPGPPRGGRLWRWTRR